MLLVALDSRSPASRFFGEESLLGKEARGVEPVDEAGVLIGGGGGLLVDIVHLIVERLVLVDHVDEFHADVLVLLSLLVVLLVDFNVVLLECNEFDLEVSLLVNDFFESILKFLDLLECFLFFDLQL